MSKAVSLSLLLSLSGCTYASTEMLSTDTALISASDSEGSAKAVRSKALVTAARQARQRGYEYFAVVALKEGWQSNDQAMRDSIVSHTTSQHGSWDAPFRSATTDLTVRFLHASELPQNRAGIYETSAVLAH
jgi:hypothetical protein